MPGKAKKNLTKRGNVFKKTVFLFSNRQYKMHIKSSRPANNREKYYIAIQLHELVYE